MHSSFERHILYAFAHCVFAAASTNDTVLVRSDANENFSLFLHCALWWAEPTLSIKYILLAIELQIRDSRTKYFCFFFSWFTHIDDGRWLIVRDSDCVCVESNCTMWFSTVVAVAGAMIDALLLMLINDEWFLSANGLSHRQYLSCFVCSKWKKKKYTNIYRTSEQ